MQKNVAHFVHRALIMSLLCWGACNKPSCLGASGHKPSQILIQDQPIALKQDITKQVLEISKNFSEKSLPVAIAGKTTLVLYKDLGLELDETELTNQISTAQKGGTTENRVVLALPVKLNRQKALAFLMSLKEKIDISPHPENVDLEAKSVTAPQEGFAVDVWDSMALLQIKAEQLAAGSANETLSLVGQVVPAPKSGMPEGPLVVIGYYQTAYSTGAVDSDRTYNLKKGADHLHGVVIQPGQILSFNETVGDRTEKEGYRVAPVIQAGELVDGLAGGMCQLASTLHAAAQFAGLEIVKAIPHSRPSTYIPMGFDATVVYPSVDLKIKNPYNFPVILNYEISQGVVRVEILGKERPYKVAYEREIIEEKPFPLDIRYGSDTPASQTPFVDQEPIPNPKDKLKKPKHNCIVEVMDGSIMRKRRCILDQAGYPGYKIKLRRYVFTGPIPARSRVVYKRPNDASYPLIYDLIGNLSWTPENRLISKKEWTVVYPPTVEIKRIGTGGNLRPTPIPASHAIRALTAREKELYHLIQ